MAGHYRRPDLSFAYLGGSTAPGWRQAQLGALGALVAHWSVHPAEPALLSLPTGAGKSAIATAIPYLSAPTRVLVVVPSKHLRAQLAESFRTQGVLREIGALTDVQSPVVHELTGRVDDWDRLLEFDVVVALPASISPEHYENLPATDLFDLIIVDEAHHSSARTWRAILDHFRDAKRVLLTATPKRRDGKRLPGEIAYHYPLSSAIADGTYKAVRADLLDVDRSVTQDQCDALIVDRTLAVLAAPDHETSTLLVRADSSTRAHALAERYTTAGRETVVLTSRMSETKQTQIVAGLRDGSIKSVAVVGMLNEGFDLPSLRVAAYHDKHRSLAPTIQLIGRLVRASRSFPQDSVLVATRDIDVFPALQGAVRSLYDEDADWSKLLPGIIDDEIAEVRAARAFAAALETPPNTLSVEALLIPVRATVYEVRAANWLPDFEKVSSQLVPGEVIRGGHETFYSSTTPEHRSLVLVTRRTESPRWHAHAGLESSRFDLHVLTWVPPRLRGQSGLLLVNSDNGDVRKFIFEVLETADATLRGADPERLHGAFDLLPRVSVSNVGVRNTNVGGRRGSATYKTFAGSGVDRGMREVDTAQGAIGHAMAQVSQGPGEAAYNVGIAVEKAKMWESRSVPLMHYDDVMADFGARYWSSSASANPLLPDVSRGSALTEMPASVVALTEWHPGLIGADWYYEDNPLEYLDIRAVNDAADSGSSSILLEVRDHPEDVHPLWHGRQQLDGEVVSTRGALSVHRGFATDRDLADLLTQFPPSIRFASGQSVMGTVLYERPGLSRSLARITSTPLDWTGVNIQMEIDASAERAGQEISVQAHVRRYLVDSASSFEHRWILHNDGKGEFADVLVLELDVQGPVRLELWHVKPAGEATPSVRVKDIDIVGAQAAKSRRWFTDPDFFGEMRRRLDGVGTKLTVLEGSEELLMALLSEATEDTPWTLLAAKPLLRGEVVIAQPGLSWSKLQDKVAVSDLFALQVRDLLSVMDDAIGALASTRIVCSP